jgi:hypothetical protein
LYANAKRLVFKLEMGGWKGGFGVLKRSNFTSFARLRETLRHAAMT